MTAALHAMIVVTLRQKNWKMLARLREARECKSFGPIRIAP